jgi:hypothetical protein
VSSDDQFVRRAGRARLSDGRLLVWSVAEGHRGRRWRAAIRGADSGIESVLVLELDPDGASTRLELAAPDGMLTLHPETDQRSVHGNVVSDAGVRPIALSWSPDGSMHVVGHPITAAAMAHRLAGSLAVGAAVDVPIVAVEQNLTTGARACRVRHEARDRWVLDCSGDQMDVSLNPDGIPHFEGHAGEWPLEE